MQLSSNPIPNHAIDLPQSILPGIFSLPGHGEGSLAYLIVEKGGQNILIDCPRWTEDRQTWLREQGGVGMLWISHRDAISPAVGKIQDEFRCGIIIQEQEAYLIPGRSLTPFRDDYFLTPEIRALWTPGYSPGSSCLYVQKQGGILFTGRHLLPTAPGQIGPLRREKTFHWGRQLASVAKLRDRLAHKPLAYLCPGANRRYLGELGCIADPWPQLMGLDLAALKGVGSEM
ncbi:MAG: MBL fold metallo-hydrolase [Spirulina sp. DLM2.Bin59]|nr:MAG: MBL fold metallo-hydrolase [Spirulina sp. DLM2.Bin59]